jgi:hypothetical protein
MPQRIVVSFRGAIRREPSAGADYLARALATKKRAEAHGAKLCAWSAQTFSFDLATDELEEALALASIVIADHGVAGAAAFMAGVSQGELALVGGDIGFSALSWGPPLVTGVALAREAAGGEVLIDHELMVARSSEIAELGWFVDFDSARGVHSLRAATTGSFAAVTSANPPPVPRPSQPAQDPPAASRRPRQFTPPPRVTRPPLPSQPEDAFSEMAKRALVQGDNRAIERLILQLRESGHGEEVVDRLSGFAALRRGATAEALRKLRAAAEAEQAPGQRARARLAFAVALASAGRGEAALLEALDALARAREAEDATGEVACARFLARLAAAIGHLGAAKAWARIAG